MACDADLTIDGALHDPLIAAMMRADRVEPRAFETLLRSAKLRVNDDEAMPRVPMTIAARCREALFACGHPAR